MIRIGTWNILSRLEVSRNQKKDEYKQPEYHRYKFLDQQTLQCLPVELLDIDARFSKQEKIIRSLNCDILCLQEVYYVEEWSELLRDLGFTILAVAKANTPTSILVAYRATILEPVAIKMVSGVAKTDGPVRIGVVFQLVVNQKQRLSIFTTHLKAGNNDESAKIRAAQARVLLEDMQEMEETYNVNCSILAGDLNCNPLNAPTDHDVHVAHEYALDTIYLKEYQTVYSYDDIQTGSTTRKFRYIGDQSELRDLLEQPKGSNLREKCETVNKIEDHVMYKCQDEKVTVQLTSKLLSNSEFNYDHLAQYGSDHIPVTAVIVFPPNQ